MATDFALEALFVGGWAAGPCGDASSDPLHCFTLCGTGTSSVQSTPPPDPMPEQDDGLKGPGPGLGPGAKGPGPKAEPETWGPGLGPGARAHSGKKFLDKKCMGRGAVYALISPT